MIEYLSEEQVLHLHRVIIAATGGAGGVRDQGLLQSALARPAAAFGGQELYSSVPAKAAASAHIGVEEIRIWLEQRIRRE